jgi:hypothetical protein
MCCAKLGMSIKEFVIKATLDSVEAWEDIWLSEKMKNEWEVKKSIDFFDEGDKHFVRYEDGSTERVYSHDEVFSSINHEEAASDV